MRKLLFVNLFTFCLTTSAFAQSLQQLDSNCRKDVQCQCRSREIIKRTPRATLDSIMSQPPSAARQNALIQALIATAVRDNVEIMRVCGPVLHPEGET